MPLNTQRSPSSRLYYENKVKNGIPIVLLRDWTIGKRDRLDLTAAWVTIRREYCDPLIQQGYCPLHNGEACDGCRENIQGMFDLEQAKNPMALLTWLARDRRTKLEDRNQQRKAETPITNLEIHNLFKSMLE